MFEPMDQRAYDAEMTVDGKRVYVRVTATTRVKGGPTSFVIERRSRDRKAPEKVGLYNSPFHDSAALDDLLSQRPITRMDFEPIEGHVYRQFNLGLLEKPIRFFQRLVR